MASKTFWEAVKHMPSKYMIDGTQAAEFENTAIACNPNLPPIAFNPKTKRWYKMKFNPGPYRMVQVQCQ